MWQLIKYSLLVAM